MRRRPCQGLDAIGGWADGISANVDRPTREGRPGDISESGVGSLVSVGKRVDHGRIRRDLARW